MKKVLVINDGADLGSSYGRPFADFGKITGDMSLIEKDPESILCAVFTGGSDINPSLYGHKNLNSWINESRDIFEKKCFDNPWTEDEFIKFLKQRNVIGMGAEQKELVVGYMIYDLEKTHFTIHNLAVNTKREYIGSALIKKLKNKLSTNRRMSIRTKVRESNLEALLFFKNMGFLATNINPNYFCNSEDAISMCYLYNKRLDEYAN